MLCLDDRSCLSDTMRPSDIFILYHHSIPWRSYLRVWLSRQRIKIESNQIVANKNQNESIKIDYVFNVLSNPKSYVYFSAFKNDDRSKSRKSFENMTCKINCKIAANGVSWEDFEIKFCNLSGILVRFIPVLRIWLVKLTVKLLRIASVEKISIWNFVICLIDWFPLFLYFICGYSGHKILRNRSKFF